MASWNPALRPETAPAVSPRPESPTIAGAQTPEPLTAAHSEQHQEVSQRAAAPDSTANATDHPAPPDPEHRQSPVEIVPGPEEPCRSDAKPATSSLESPTHASPAATSTNTTKHASTASFARTVSQDMNWLSDDDADWDIGRSNPNGPDPSSFMPDTDRTNSFPLVPPAAPVPFSVSGPTQAVTTAPQPSQPAVTEKPLHASQAHALMDGEDSEVPDSPAEESEGRDMYRGHNGPDRASRYEEGVPLMSQSKAQPSVGDSFAEGATGDDDFFSQVQQSAEEDGQTAGSAPTLERKPTALAMGSHEYQGTNSASLETTSEAPAPVAEAKPEPTKDDLAAKWAMEFADDDDFVLDTNNNDGAADPASFFGGDDEGLLEEIPSSSAPAPTPTVTAPAPEPARGPNGRHVSAPAAPAAPAQTSTYTQPSPSPSWHPQVPPTYQQQNAPTQSPYLGATQSPYLGAYNPPPAQAETHKQAESFANKAKGGYHSPYDLPMEVVKPKKRTHAHQVPQGGPGLVAPQAPPRSSSMDHQPPSQRKDSGSSASSYGAQMHPLHPPDGQRPAVKHTESFFEDLPITSKPRPASRHNQPSPAHQTNPYASPPQAGPQVSPHVPPSMGYAAPPQPTHVTSPLASPPTNVSAPPMPGLVAPPRAGPYALVQASTHPQAPPASGTATSASYSPNQTQGPPAGNAPPPPQASNRYSPAPPGSKPHVPGYMHSAAPPVLAHQPRTSSPLTHYETYDTAGSEKPRVSSAPVTSDMPLTRSNSSGYPHPVNRVPSLPPTREVDEEPDLQQAPRLNQGSSSLSYSSSPTESRYHTMSPKHLTPPAAGAAQMLSPPKRTNYAPQTAPPTQSEFAPPPRSQTQSPGALYGNRNGKVADPIPRPSSASSPNPTSTYAPAQAQAPAPQPPTLAPARPPVSRTRGMSQNLNMIPPTDGREQDPLQRWKGCPVFAWGVGGSLVTSFPKDIPRYGGMNSSVPSVVRSPGEVKLTSVKEVQPLEERLAKFPGPLKGKSKKKETVAWLSAGIESLEGAISAHGYHAQNSHDEKRALERLLLWKILRVFVEHDGVLEGSEAVDKAVREVMTPGIGAQGSELSPAYANGQDTTALRESAMTRMQSDVVDSATVEKIRNSLLQGGREGAVWAAVDKRLWGHAMLIARTMSPEFFMKVSQEFIRKEVNFPSHNNESLAALYGVFSGNFTECVDELVPVHTRTGLRLMGSDSSPDTAKSAMDGLDKWRETIGLILSNRTVDDTRALVSLGNLLAGYGRAEAAHICFLFARSVAVFGGVDDPSSNFVLVGADHRQQSQHLAYDTEALLLSEAYEYGLSLAGGPTAGMGTPHLAAYKLQHAMTLAEYGRRDKALEYCEALTSAIGSQTRKSPYYNLVLETAVDDLTKRLRQAPREESNSWIPKPSMTKMSDSLFSKFNKFVAGDDNEDARSGSPTEGPESGPFSRIQGGTPTISRSPSVTNFEPPPYPSNNTVSAPPPPITRAASRYAPAPSGAPAPAPPMAASGYAPAPRPSLERTSSQYSQGASGGGRYEPNGYAPQPANSAPQGYPASNLSREPSYTAAPPLPDQRAGSSQYQPAPPPPSASTGYQPLASAEAIASSSSDAVSNTADQSDGPVTAPSIGYPAPSYGYEPTPVVPAEPEASAATDADQQNEGNEEQKDEASTGGYQPPSYGFEPPSYEPYKPDESDEDESKPKAKKKTIFDDDEDDIPALKQETGGKSKSEKDKENEEMFRKAAEEDAKRAEAEKAQKASGGFFSGWFGGKKKDQLPDAPKAITAKLGDKNNFVFDPELDRWVNKSAGAEQTQAKSSAAPPPKGPSPRSLSGTPPPPAAANGRVSSAPPPRSFTPNPSGLGPGVLAPPMMRTASNTSTASLPPRPGTALSTASSIDDLLGPAGPRKGRKKPRKSGRYVDVMAAKD